MKPEEFVHSDVIDFFMGLNQRKNPVQKYYDSLEKNLEAKNKFEKDLCRYYENNVAPKTTIEEHNYKFLWEKATHWHAIDHWKIEKIKEILEAKPYGDE